MMLLALTIIGKTLFDREPLQPLEYKIYDSLLIDYSGCKANVQRVSFPVTTGLKIF
jgi:hypothetical protein